LPPGKIGSNESRSVISTTHFGSRAPAARLRAARAESDQGADTFDFDKDSDSKVGGGATGRDIILFFSHAEGDLIDVSTIDANSHVGGNQKFELIGTGKFTGNASDSQHRGELRFHKHDGASIVQGDVNGDKVADFEIDVRVNTLHASDFVL